MRFLRFLTFKNLFKIFFGPIFQPCMQRLGGSHVVDTKSLHWGAG